MTSIPVSKKHGVNPTIGVCPNCGKENGELLLLGRCSKYECQACGRTIYGRIGPRGVCPFCKSARITLVDRDVEAPGRIPTGLCDDCKEMFEEHKALVRQGGIYWRCRTCGSEGVVRPGTPVALMIRHKTGIAAPKPCGVEFTEEQCPACTGRKEETNA